MTAGSLAEPTVHAYSSAVVFRSATVDWSLVQAGTPLLELVQLVLLLGEICTPRIGIVPKRPGVGHQLVVIYFSVLR